MLVVTVLLSSSRLHEQLTWTAPAPDCIAATGTATGAGGAPGTGAAGHTLPHVTERRGHMMLVSTDLGTRVSSRPSARPVEDLPRWRGRLEQLWRLQVEGIIELSLAYHEAASAARVGGRPAPAGFRRRQVRRILARTASAHHALAEIEAAMGRVDTASYGICESCRLPMRAGWLHAFPQIRYCQDCGPHQNGPQQVSLARAGASAAKIPAAAWT